MAEIYLAGGCFWGTEKYISAIRGVTFTEVGYANGITERPTYEEVCTGDTGHAETVHVKYDPSVLPLEFLLELLRVIRPLPGQLPGGDAGTQYRTGMITPTLRIFDNRALIVSLPSGVKPVANEVCRFQTSAEEYHQKYLTKPGLPSHSSIEDAAYSPRHSTPQT